MFLNNMNLSVILSVIESLSPEARRELLAKIGITSDDDLKQFLGQAMVPEHVHLEAERMQYPEYRAHKLLSLYVPPILLLLGTFGNVFSFLILRHKVQKQTYEVIFSVFFTYTFCKMQDLKIKYDCSRFSVTSSISLLCSTPHDFSFHVEL